MRRISTKFSLMAGLRAALAATSCLGLALFAATPAQARWLRADAQHFVVYSSGSERRLREYTQDLEDFDGLLRLLNGVTAASSPVKVEIYLFPHQEDITRIVPGAAGFYEAKPAGIKIFASLEWGTTGEFFPTHVVFHEYTHHFVAQYFTGYYPTWINEGLANYYGGAVFDGDTVELGRGAPELYVPLKQNRWLPIEALVGQHNSLADGDAPGMFYPESWAAIHYLMRDNAHRAQLTAYILAVRGGAKPADAFPKAFGMSFADFQKTLERYVPRMTFSRLGRPPHGPTDIRVTALPDSTDRTVPLFARVWNASTNSSDAPRMLEEARAAAEADPDDPWALKTVAWAEAKFGDLTRADAALAHWIAIAPKTPEAYYLRGRGYLVEAARLPDQRGDLQAKARAAFAQAYALDDSYFPAIYLSGLSHLKDPGPIAENTVTVLEAAHDLAPQVDEISITTAQALMRARRYAEVVQVLEPIAYGPHARAEARRARTLLARARRLAADPSAAAEPEPEPEPAGDPKP